MNHRINIGIMSEVQFRERMLAIARGEYQPAADEPKIWFSSMKSLAEVLSDENRALLRVIHESQPASITELAIITGRKQSNLSRTLKTMSRYGLVEMLRENRQVKPVVKATEFQILAA
ncbi:helix-turn-helix domain-containing protein [Methylophilus sp. DW102]|uniref:HVO_A0114 family putative DNA-binding protein n=1 Tax=Methylophilus sp. DW102 TaxID=3095607 RepID=UPI0030876514|nr:transcriptional regulator [Methylophilus sp. DW102]